MKFGVRSSEDRSSEGISVRSSGVGVRSVKKEFGVRSSEFGFWNLKIHDCCCRFCALVNFILQPSAFASDKWAGVDESVVKKVAQEQGRKAWKPIINTDQGDLLLFVFLLAGAVGGFIAGYYWRILMVERSTSHLRRNRNPDGTFLSTLS